jgi:predicted DNA-binding transcriptional regulator YafY
MAVKKENEHNVFNRREEIKNIIIYKRKTTNAELRQRFNVDRKTIKNDIKFLSSLIPLRTEPGNGGGIILDISFERRMEYLRPYEKDVLLKVMEYAEPYEKRVIENIIYKYSLP